MFIIRKGMWCVDETDRVGILLNVGLFEVNRNEVWRDSAKCEFHLVGPDGCTIERVWRNIAGLRQATHEEIPASRRPHESVSRRLGYIRGN